MGYKFNEGGRVEAGLKSKTDCGIRAVAIATGLTYDEARTLLKYHSKKGKMGSAAISRGIYKEDMTSALATLGWVWNSAPKFVGRKARYSDIEGKAILRMAKHYSTVIDGTLFDSWDSSHKMVYGYWAYSRAYALARARG